MGARPRLLKFGGPSPLGQYNFTPGYDIVYAVMDFSRIFVQGRSLHFGFGTDMGLWSRGLVREGVAHSCHGGRYNPQKILKSHVHVGEF
jgi:hypothetical protein